MTRPRLLVSALTDHRPTSREQSLLEALQGSVLSQAISSWDVHLHIADSDPRPVSEIVEGIDAVILLGGPDVHPEFYGMETGYPREGQHWPDGDRRQIELVLQCRERQLPLLGICRGHQVINVAYGGTLIQDMEGHESPTLLDDHRFTRHQVIVEDESSLARAGFGHELTVSSAHHQAIDCLATGLRSIASSPDGTIEAVEDLNAPIVGVQWHPEDPRSDRYSFELLLGMLREGLHS
ncbi:MULTISPECIES: gamma-glutamyl-gamma-aminobutyrate hydrolase family protein [Actinomyces]|uniref:gamma-glutamyl-gamma-aminobutyrate hydrolase family protein n=1 Tax=Actinomyces TaxID=1654 RepID=UPI00093119C9|nr:MULTISPECIES: gamma-glutamyl-gamma-aminobutyrate hydrolase family protein [Actinomyces]